MNKTTLHITNGSILTEKLEELDFKGEFLTWHEMLCEGPTTEQIDTQEFLDLRKSFFDSTYELDFDESEFHKEIDKLIHSEKYSEIVLWFEYDLFCHINLIAVINLLKQKHINVPIYLVCSGRIKHQKELKGLTELSTSQLLKHFNKKIILTPEDIELATTIWGIYCGKSHNLLKPFIVQSSSFDYLSNCLKAHLERFPDSINGLCIIEKHILKTINSNEVKSKYHLLGYILNYQGFYGYGDLQLERIIDKLEIFFYEEDHKLHLNKKGKDALFGSTNFALELNNNIDYGGVNRLEFQFDKAKNKLIKFK